MDCVRTYCEGGDIHRMQGICLPPLKTIIKTDELDYRDAGLSGYSIPMGWYDDPEQQRQGIMELELSGDNIYIVGSAQTGKTSLLQTIAYGIMRKFSPGQINMYMIDCGIMPLKKFENSRHVGGVVLSDEEEKCGNRFNLLHTVITRRKKALSDRGVGNYAFCAEAGYTDLPLVVLMIDNISGRCRETPGGNAGSGLFMSDGRILEFQAAIFGKSAKESERSREWIEYIEERNRDFEDRPVSIPMV